MKKITSNIACFISGVIIASTVGAVAASYTATENTFPIKVNGQNVQMEGYNIEGNTYFKLRDIGDKMGFDVGFENNTILIGENSTVSNNSHDIAIDSSPKEFYWYSASGKLKGHLKLDSINLSNPIDTSMGIQCDVVFSGTEYKDTVAMFYLKCLDKDGVELKKVLLSQDVTTGAKFKATKVISIPKDTAFIIPVEYEL